MTAYHPRPCPLCSGNAENLAFPYSTLFNNTHFYYLKCTCCSSVFVDPVPDVQTFAKMYAKNDYHDCHYQGVEGGVYSDSVRLLQQYLPSDTLVLDYGCGVGAFLKALKLAGFTPYGVEFDADAAHFAGQNAGCETLSVHEFFNLPMKSNFDAIHLGDVLEHLPDPMTTLSQLLDYLRPDGILFVEGPLENNPSPVCWFAHVFGILKRVFKPNFIASNPPTHLFRTDATAQFDFFQLKNLALSPVVWRVYETGWPYASGSIIKRIIANIAIMMGGREYLGITFGNRFEGLFVKQNK